MSNEYEGTLELESEPRMDRYEVLSPMGYIIEVTHNIETGEHSYVDTDRTQYATDPGTP